MKILLDTNVIMTYLTGREDKYTNESKVIMTKCIQKKAGWFCCFSFAFQSLVSLEAISS